MIAPCMDCPDRVVGCHTNCEKYQSFAAGIAEQRAKTELARHVAAQATDHEFRRQLQIRKASRRRGR